MSYELRIYSYEFRDVSYKYITLAFGKYLSR
jgi:hypothetical protein